ncbi:MAG: proline--tRNA ligase [Clostridia bacterium]|nr:proline--tRNA ligase [Clostridia bacterium]
MHSREFWWQEGHTLHETPEEAVAETEQMLKVYADFCEKDLGIPVVKGRKSESDKFAGAEATYAIEALMHDGKALQAGTSHYFGDGFARAFDIQFTTRENKKAFPFQTSWGVTTRLIGAIIMTHGDDRGLVLPPKVAPIQAVIVPVAQHKPGVLDAAAALKERLSAFRVKLDDTENSPGWKFAEYEMRGVPVRIELGPRDIEAGQCVFVTRFDGQKKTVALADAEKELEKTLADVTAGMYEKALANQKARTYTCRTLDEIRATLAEKGPGFFRAAWCGSPECEKKVKEETGVGSRCIPLEQGEKEPVCVCCGKPAAHMVLWGIAY